MEDLRIVSKHVIASYYCFSCFILVQLVSDVPPQQQVIEPPKEPEVRKQTVVVYKQNADGSTVNTGQVVQLTQAQIIQLLNTGTASQQKPITIANALQHSEQSESTR